MPIARGETISILVVEDDHAVSELVRSILNQVPGWGTTVVHDAVAAREVFRHVRIEILVLDVNLPEISGLELLQLLRQDSHWNEPLVVLMSANIEQPEIVGAARGGLVTKLIRKPFDVDQLVEEIELAIAAGGRQRHCQVEPMVSDREYHVATGVGR